MKKQFLLSIILIGMFATSRSQSITELGFFTPLISTFDMKYSNNHLIISQQGMKIFDVTNPANPQQVGSATYPGSYAYQLAVNGNYAYMGEGGSGYFSVYSISNFNSPTLTGSTIIPSTAFVTGGDLIVTNNTAYMTGADSLYVVDVSNLASPALITSLQAIDLPPFGVASSVAVDGNTLFVLHSLGITAYDISNPSAPIALDTIPLSHAYHTGLAVDTIGHRLFSPWLTALQTHLGFDAYDISSPSSPSLLFSDSIVFGSGEFGVTDYYNNLLVISQGGGVTMWDVSSSTHGFLTSFTGQNVPNSTVSIEFRDSVFYNSRRGGFEILRYNGGFPTAINETGITHDDFTIYPNPVTNKYLNLRENLKNSSIQISNIEGKIVWEEKNINSKTIALDNLQSGLYFIHITTDKSIITKKFIFSE